MRNTWRDIARPIIDRVLKEVHGKSEKEIREALRKAYPFGQRQYHPYKIWCDEIKIQRGQKKSAAKNKGLNQGDLFK